MNSRLPGLFVTGTDTGVGKTRIAAAIARVLTGAGHNVAVLKPVATGVERDEHGLRIEDAERLRDGIGRPVPLERITPIVFEAPLAPCVAARREGRRLEHAQLIQTTRSALTWWQEQGADLVLVEGVGGFLCPLGERSTVADLALELDLPLLVVARRALGTLNHTLLTIEAIRLRGLRIAGVVLNSPEPGRPGLAEQTNRDELSRRLDTVPILAELEYSPTDEALSAALAGLDWAERMARSRLGASNSAVRPGSP